MRRPPTQPSRAVAEPLGPAHILFLDDRLAAIAKPPGLSLATPQRAPEEAVVRLLAALPHTERARLEGGGLPLLVHRLDVGTSGLVLLARGADAHRELVSAFANRQVEKTYLALVWGHPRPRQGVYEQPLGPDRDDRRRMRVDSAGRPARTGYQVLSAPPHVALTALRPETGRTHQIRVHLSAAGHPIVGDDLYGGPRHRGVRDPALRRALDPPHTLLHAWTLILPTDFAVLPAAPLPAAFRAALLACDIAEPVAAGRPAAGGD